MVILFVQSVKHPQIQFVNTF